MYALARSRVLLVIYITFRLLVIFSELLSTVTLQIPLHEGRASSFYLQCERKVRRSRYCKNRSTILTVTKHILLTVFWYKSLLQVFLFLLYSSSLLYNNIKTLINLFTNGMDYDWLTQERQEKYAYGAYNSLRVFKELNGKIL